MASSPASAPTDGEDHQAVSLSDLLRLERRLWEVMDATSRRALRATSREMLHEADQGVRILDCPEGNVDDDEDSERLVALLRRLPCLRVLKLNSLLLVEAVFSDCEDVSAPSMCPQLVALDISMSRDLATQLTQQQLASACTGGAARFLVSLQTSANWADTGQIHDLSPLAGCTQLTRLELGMHPLITSISPLRSLIHLQRLDLSNTGITTLAPLSVLADLRTLELNMCMRLSCLQPISGCTLLTELILMSASVSSLEPLRSLKLLEELDVCFTDNLSSLEPLTDCPSLSTLRASACRNVTSLEFLRCSHRLVNFSCSNCWAVSSLEPLRSCPLLEGLNISGLSFGSLEPLCGLTRLTLLHLANLLSFPSLEPLRALPLLEQLDLSGYMDLTSLEPLRALPLLATLNLSRCGGLTSLEPLADHSRLKQLSIEGCQQLPATAFAPLASCIALETLEMRDCHVLFDLAPLASCPKLRWLVTPKATSLDLAPLQGLTNLTVSHFAEDELLYGTVASSQYEHALQI